MQQIDVLSRDALKVYLQWLLGAHMPQSDGVDRQLREGVPSEAGEGVKS